MTWLEAQRPVASAAQMIHAEAAARPAAQLLACKLCCSGLLFLMRAVQVQDHEARAGQHQRQGVFCLSLACWIDVLKHAGELQKALLQGRQEVKLERDAAP